MRKLISAVFACFIALVFAAQGGTDGVSAALELPARPVYVGEEFDLVLRIESVNTRLAPEMQLGGMPPQEVLATGPFSELPLQRETVGAGFREVRRLVTKARAVTEGTVPLVLALHITVQERRQMIIGFTMIESTRVLRVEPARLTVRNMPADGRSPDFSGAVGSFDLDVTVAPTNPVLGDLVRVTMRIAGQGNTSSIKPPSVKAASGFTLYEPRRLPSTAHNELVFEQVLIPQNTNARAVPAVTLSFFDAVSGGYRTLTRGPFVLSFREPGTEQFTPFVPKPEITDAGNGAGTESIPLQADRSEPWARQVLIAVYWMAALFVSIAVGARGGSRGKAATVAAALVFTVAYFPVRMAVNRMMPDTSELVVVRHDVPARFAPADTAIETFRIRSGETVETLQKHEGWLKVKRRGDIGWIPGHTVLDGNAGPSSAPHTDAESPL